MKNEQKIFKNQKLDDSLDKDFNGFLNLFKKDRSESQIKKI